MISNFFRSIELTQIGLSLCVMGIPLGMYLDFFYRGSIKWTIIIMLLSIILVVDWRNLLRLRFPSKNPTIFWILFFQFVMLFYGFQSPNMSFQFLSFHLYVIALCFSIASLKKTVLLDKLPIYVFFMSIPSCLAGFFIIYSGLLDASYVAYLERQSISEVYNIDPLTISAGALYLLFACLCIKIKKRWLKLIEIVFCILSCYILLFCNKRTPLFIFIVGIFLTLYMKKEVRLKVFPKLFSKIFLTAALFLLAYISIDFVQENVDKFFESFYNGVLGLLGDQSANYSVSVEERIKNRHETVLFVENNFELFNYIFGGGYFVKWVDFPLFQAYLDMGIIGFLLFTYIVLILPFSFFRNKILDHAFIFAFLITLDPMFTVISSGHPYQPNKYIPICILSLVYYHQKNKQYVKTLCNL